LAGAETGPPQRLDHGFGVALRGSGFVGSGDHQRYFSPRPSTRRPFLQSTQRTGAHFLVQLRQFPHHHRWSIAKNFNQVVQRPPESLCGFEQDQWESRGRRPPKQPQPLSSLPRQESERQKWAVDQS